MTRRRVRRTRRLAAVLPLLLLAAPATPSPEASVPASGGTVILLHGLGRSAGSMRMFERGLGARGYEIRNVGYPSREAPVEELTAHVAAELERCCADPAVPVHFVAHSMGGILVRAFLANDRPANLGRVVMLAPPNQGSEWVDEFRDHAIFGWAGPAAAELGTDDESVPRRLGPVDYELGVLIGNWSWNPVGSWLIPGDDDGTVGVESAKVEGMADFRVIPATHTFILRSRRVLAEVEHFLENGAFIVELETD